METTVTGPQCTVGFRGGCFQTYEGPTVTGTTLGDWVSGAPKRLPTIPDSTRQALYEHPVPTG